MKQLNARKFRVVLLFIILITTVIIVSGFLYAQKNIYRYATEISELNTRAQSGEDDLKVLRNLESRLKELPNVSSDADAFLASESSYRKEAINDINDIAEASDVSVLGYQFQSESGDTSTTPPTAGAQTTPQQTTTTTLPAGISKKTVTVNIKSPLSYTKLLNFISKLESNRLKLQLDGISMSKDQGNVVSTQALTISVYIRSGATS